MGATVESSKNRNVTVFKSVRRCGIGPLIPDLPAANRSFPIAYVNPTPCSAPTAAMATEPHRSHSPDIELGAYTSHSALLGFHIHLPYFPSFN